MRPSLFFVSLALITVSLTTIANVPKSYKVEDLLPVYAAYLSDEHLQVCESTTCVTNLYDGNELSSLVARSTFANEVLAELLNTEYEVLIGNFLIEKSASSHELVFDISINWRGILIDDKQFKLVFNNTQTMQQTKNSVPFKKSSEVAALALLEQWYEHITQASVLSATHIYQTIGASDYKNEMQVPERIGDFLLSESALYKDPMKGAITRYHHPDFDSAILDISIYPMSPFGNKTPLINSEAPTHISNHEIESLYVDMGTERGKVIALIESSSLNDFSVSSIEPTSLMVNNNIVHGLAFEVAINEQTDPVYSTQFAFIQHDKIIKLSGNLPESMMRELVYQSMPYIKAPQESMFMKMIRQSAI